MGEVADRLTGQIKEALKAGDRPRLATLRLLAAAVKNREVELRHELTEAELVEVAGREVKRRQEAAEAFEKGGRPELAEKERAEQVILEAYLPEQLSDQELGRAVDEAIAATGASGPNDVGKVMGQVMARHKGRVDGSAVNRLVRERLG
ncbi:MAG: GatB/YqeY domain-containing protein [Acidimicrobiia bacterium]